MFSHLLGLYFAYCFRYQFIWLTIIKTSKHLEIARSKPFLGIENFLLPFYSKSTVSGIISTGKEKDRGKEREHLEKQKTQLLQVVSYLSGVLGFTWGPGSVKISPTLKFKTFIEKAILGKECFKGLLWIWLLIQKLISFPSSLLATFYSAKLLFH